MIDQTHEPFHIGSCIDFLRLARENQSKPKRERKVEGNDATNVDIHQASDLANHAMGVQSGMQTKQIARATSNPMEERTEEMDGKKGSTEPQGAVNRGNVTIALLSPYLGGSKWCDWISM